MSRTRAGLPLLLLAAACAHSSFDATLREGSLEDVLAAFAREDARSRPDATLQVALLLRERGSGDDTAAARALLDELVRERPETPQARAARALLRLDGRLAAAGDSLAVLAEVVRSLEAEAARRTLRLRQLEHDMALRDSLVNVLTRTAGRLEEDLAAERRELDELRETLELLMEVDMDVPPVPAGEPEAPPAGPEP